jgi:hypothetical protein
MAKSLRTFAALVLAGGVIAVASGHARQTAPATDASMAQLLAEVRAIRTEIRDAAGSSLRAQLVGMRLQLQEQRITTVSRQLFDVQEKLRTAEGSMVPLTNALKMFTNKDDPGNDDPANDKAMFALVTAPLKAQIEQIEKSIAQLKQEELAASQLLAEEQSRWTRFNALVEELEKAAATPTKR